MHVDGGHFSLRTAASLTEDITYGLARVRSTANLTDRVRLSCDVRWQRAAESVDERYVGTLQEMQACRGGHSVRFSRDQVC